MDKISDLSREELIDLVHIYAKNMLALDGVWFQSVESKLGMEEAMEHDRNAWLRYTVVEARRIKEFLHLSEQAGLEGLKKALAFRFYAALNGDEIIVDGDTLIYRTLSCRVQNARARKGMPFHPCKSVGILEYTYFAKEIDSRFECEALSCYPDVTDESCACAWKFTLIC
ncbi:MAG: DUF6125 family protein [Paludibacteraceae bacterium]|nr:DUF6125 family protein [Paludibacteraceae bacterium]HOI26107.1 DUF6125 family protein [Paludibacteraceae bacterium]HPH63992.1 DUF6125 family protein [Paludibacteraceae bacterium]